MMRSLSAVTAVLAIVTAAWADLPPLHVLDQSERSVTIGSAAFSVSVDSTGRIKSIQSGGTEYVSFVALYSNPTSSESDNTIRVVQVETGEGRGIAPAPETILVQRRGEHYFISISQTAARPEFSQGKPLYELHQTVEIGPNAVVRVRYQFNWLRFFRVNRPTIYVGLSGPTFAELPFYADYTSHRSRGIFSAEKQYETYAGLSGPLRTLLVDCPAGPFHLWVGSNASVISSHWGDRYSAIGLHVPGTASGQPMYAGVTSEVEFTTKLPLPSSSDAKGEH